MKKTLVDIFEDSVKQYPDNPFLWEKTNDKFEPTTYTQVKDQVYKLSAGLMALGVKKGDNMALLSEGRNAWIIGELAMFYAGAVNAFYKIGRGKRFIIPSYSCRCKIHNGIGQSIKKNSFNYRSTASC